MKLKRELNSSQKVNSAKVVNTKMSKPIKKANLVAILSSLEPANLFGNANKYMA